MLPAGPYERRFRSSAAGLAPINVAKDSLVIYSVGLGQVSNESVAEQSLFMTELLKELRSPGVSAEEVFARTRIGVSRASESDQVPWVASSLVESFYFVLSGSPGGRQRSADPEKHQCMNWMRPADRMRLTSHPTYRPDIDGLRGIAVLAIVGLTPIRSVAPSDDLCNRTLFGDHRPTAKHHCF